MDVRYWALEHILLKGGKAPALALGPSYPDLASAINNAH